MGQKYRVDPASGRSSYLEPSAPQLSWLQQAAEDDRLPTRCCGCGHAVQPSVKVSCRDRGWVRSVPRDAHYWGKWYITPAGRAEVQHHADRAALAAATGLPNSPRLAKLL